MGELKGGMKIFAGSANQRLTKNIAENLGVSVGLSTAKTFSDGEISIQIGNTVREKDVYIIQSTCHPVNDNLMELLIMADAMKRASAMQINAVIPYFGYARQDRKTRARDPISAKLVANLITAAGVHRVITMDLHCDQIQGFFDSPVDHLRGVSVLSRYYQEKFAGADDLTVVSPDLGSVARARAFAAKLDAPMAIVDKRRPKANEVEFMNLIGDVAGRKVLLVDDMIDTAGSITQSAKALKDRGAASVFACCTHPVFSGEAIERLADSPVEELLILDTIPLKPEKLIDKIKVLSVADVFAEAIRRIHNGEPVSELFA
jgi:ribose-phosphate pyrophosphokinase